MSGMTYTCLMSVYDKEDPLYLKTSLESLFDQTVPPEEILIVKDGHLPDSLENVLQEYCARYPNIFTIVGYESNQGLWYALKYGVVRCRNQLIMRMDVDDWSSPLRAEKELAVFESDPSIDCVGTLVVEFQGDLSNEKSYVELPETNDEIEQFGKRRCPFRHPTLMFKKSAVLEAGNYQEMPFFEDYDLYFRMKKSGSNFFNIQEKLVYVRVGEEFFYRRGSFSYMKHMLHFKTNCLSKGYFNLLDFVVTAAPHIVVSLMPNKLRTFVYSKFLRSPAKGKG